jgi:rhamnosyl/mannosyltransferase
VVCCELNNGVTWVNRHEVTGLVVPPADASALAAALDRLRTDGELRRKLGTQALKRALAEFSIQSMASGTLDVYRRILEQPSIQPA